MVVALKVEMVVGAIVLTGEGLNVTGLGEGYGVGGGGLRATVSC